VTAILLQAVFRCLLARRRLTSAVQHTTQWRTINVAGLLPPLMRQRFSLPHFIGVAIFVFAVPFCWGLANDPMWAAPLWVAVLAVAALATGWRLPVTASSAKTLAVATAFMAAAVIPSFTIGRLIG
jgi:hypothetical protein